jgi:hypothetical protein
MAKRAEYHLTIHHLPDGEYTLLEGLPSEHKLKSWGAHRYDIDAGVLTLWLVNCQLSAKQAFALARDAIDAIDADE